MKTLSLEEKIEELNRNLEIFMKEENLVLASLTRKEKKKIRLQLGIDQFVQDHEMIDNVV